MPNPRDAIFKLFEAVRRLGLTAFFICEMTGEEKKQFGEFGVEDYLSDGVIHLTMERTGDQQRSIDAGLRVGLAILTEAILVAPLEGIGQVRLLNNVKK